LLEPNIEDQRVDLFVLPRCEGAPPVTLVLKSSHINLEIVHEVAAQLGDRPSSLKGLGAVVKQEPTTDERAGMNWWNTLSELERSQVLVAAGWKSGATGTPRAADAWAYHKKSIGQEDAIMSEPPVHVDLDLPSSAALALAQFVKRVTWKEMRERFARVSTRSKKPWRKRAMRHGRFRGPRPICRRHLRNGALV